MYVRGGSVVKPQKNALIRRRVRRVAVGTVALLMAIALLAAFMPAMSALDMEPSSDSASVDSIMQDEIVQADSDPTADAANSIADETDLATQEPPPPQQDEGTVAGGARQDEADADDAPAENGQPAAEETVLDETGTLQKMLGRRMNPHRNLPKRVRMQKNQPQ